MPLVINVLGGEQTQAYIATHKPKETRCMLAAGQRVPGLKTLYGQIGSIQAVYQLPLHISQNISISMPSLTSQSCGNSVWSEL